MGKLETQSESFMLYWSKKNGGSDIRTDSFGTKRKPSTGKCGKSHKVVEYVRTLENNQNGIKFYFVRAQSM